MTDGPNIDQRFDLADEADETYPVDQMDDTPAPDAWVADVDLKELARQLARMGGQWATVMELLRQPQPVWVRPSDRVAMPSGTVSATGHSLIEASPDRLRVTIRNLEDPGGTSIWLVPGSERAVRLGTMNGFELAAGESITIDTKASIAGFTTAGTAAWCALSEHVELGQARGW